MHMQIRSTRSKTAKAPLPSGSCALSVDFDELSSVPAYARKGVTVAHTVAGITITPAARPARVIAH